MQKSRRATASLSREALTSIRDTPVDIGRLIHMLYQDVERQITRADQKAQVVIAVSTILITATAFLGIDSDALSDVNVVEAIAIIGYVLAAVLLAGAMLFALRAVFPRSEVEADDDLPANVFFTGHAATASHDDYIEEFMDLNLHELKKTIFSQIQEKSKVVTHKYDNLRVSIYALSVAVMVLGLAQIFSLIGHNI